MLHIESLPLWLNLHSNSNQVKIAAEKIHSINIDIFNILIWVNNSNSKLSKLNTNGTKEITEINLDAKHSFLSLGGSNPWPL